MEAVQEVLRRDLALVRAARDGCTAALDLAFAALKVPTLDLARTRTLGLVALAALKALPWA